MSSKKTRITKKKDTFITVMDNGNPSHKKSDAAGGSSIITELNNSVDEVELARIVGREVKEGFTIDSIKKTVIVGDLVLPLHLVRRKCVKSQGDFEFPPEAYAMVPDQYNPETWCFRLWESPTLKVTTKSLWACSEEMGKAPEEIRSLILPTIKKHWEDLYGSAAVAPLFDSNVSVVQESDIEEEEVKSGVEEKPTTFRFRLRNPEDFTQGSFRTIHITSGVSAVIGKRPDAKMTELQSLVFDKVRFPTKSSVTSWLRNHPDIRSSRMRKSDDDSYIPFLNPWRESGHSILFKSGSGCSTGRFIIESAVYAPPALAAVPTSTLKAIGYTPQYTLRCATIGEEESGWAIGLDSNIFNQSKESDRVCVSTPPVFPVGMSVNKDSATTGETRTDVLATGDWRLAYSSPDVIALLLESETFGCLGLVLQSSGDFWLSQVMGPEEMAATSDVQDHMKECWKNKASWLLWPTENISEPFAVIDVDKTVKHSLPFRIVKSSDASAATKQYTLGIAYPALRVDAHGDFATHEDLERAAWEYSIHHRTIGVRHKNGTEGAGVVVESYIYRGPIWEMKDASGKTQTVHPGDWMLGVIWSDGIWHDGIATGELSGYSFEGWSN